MKNILALLVLGFAAVLFLPKESAAQVPQLFNYQGIARDAGGNVLPNRVIGVQLSVLDGGPTGTVVYQETFRDTTNAFGLFTIQVGGGSVVSGTFGGINWATGNKYLKTAIDLAGGTNYALSGTTQLVSVPYALYAQSAATLNSSPLLFKLDSTFSGIITNYTGYNTYFGYEDISTTVALSGFPNGNSNTAYGSDALANIAPTGFSPNGNSNTAVGVMALFSNSGGTGNIGIGVNALKNNTTGFFNVALGSPAGYSNATGSSIITIGYNSDVSMDGLTNATALGTGAIVDASNKVRIGNTAVTVIEGQVPFTTPSDGRFKFNIKEDVKGLDFILKLRPVTYQFNTKKEEDFIRGVKGGGDSAGAMPVAYGDAMMVRRTGFIAQEVEKAAQRSRYDFDGLKAPKTEKEYYSLSYASFVVPLVKAVQEQEETIRQQNQHIDDLTNQVKELRQLILAAAKK